MKTLLLLLVAAFTFAAENGFSAQRTANERAQPAAATLPPPGTNAITVGENRTGGYVLDSEKHKLGPGDKITFRITEDRGDPQVSLMITESGELDVPYAGPGHPPLRVKATAKTCRDLEQELKSLLEQDYYFRATVKIGLDAVSKNRGKVYMFGAVRTQGAIDIPTEENFTVAKAIMRAGGFGEFADQRKVKLNRSLPNGAKQEEILNMEEIIQKGKSEKDKTLQDGDFIVVPEKTWNF